MKSVEILLLGGDDGELLSELHLPVHVCHRPGHPAHHGASHIAQFQQFYLIILSLLVAEVET